MEFISLDIAFPGSFTLIQGLPGATVSEIRGFGRGGTDRAQRAALEF